MTEESREDTAISDSGDAMVRLTHVTTPGRPDLSVIAPGAWPLDEGWETWRPPAGWDEPLWLPASVALPS